MGRFPMNPIPMDKPANYVRCLAVYHLQHKVTQMLQNISSEESGPCRTETVEVKKDWSKQDILVSDFRKMFAR